MEMNLLLLTCANKNEANNITKVLLEKKLIICSKRVPVSSSFLWKGKIEESSEILLIMDSLIESFEKINTEVKKLHSYETFVLTSMPVNGTTKEVKAWVKEELKK